MGLYWKAKQASTSVSKSDPTGNIEKLSFKFRAAVLWRLVAPVFH